MPQYEVPCSVLIKKAIQYSNKILELIYVAPVFKHFDITYKCKTFLASLCFELFFFKFNGCPLNQSLGLKKSKTGILAVLFLDIASS